MALSDRVRPNVEAAAWVIEEIKQLEEENLKLRKDKERIDWLENNPLMADVSFDNELDDGYLYGVIGAPGLTLRELIDGLRKWRRLI